MVHTTVRPRAWRRGISVVVLLAAQGLAAPDEPAPVRGRYAGTAVLGPVLLDGRYPLRIGEGATGTLDVTPSATGALSGQVRYAAQSLDVTGAVRTVRNSIRLDLRAASGAGAFTLTATLRGGAFVGTVKLGKQVQTCRVAVGDVARLAASYDLTLASSPKGAITGTGTVSVGRETIAVKVRGGLRKGRVVLGAAGGKTSLRIDRGEVGDGAATLTSPVWKVRGFGAVASSGAPLVLRRQ